MSRNVSLEKLKEVYDNLVVKGQFNLGKNKEKAQKVHAAYKKIKKLKRKG